MKRVTVISEMNFSIKKQPSIDNDFIKRSSGNMQQIYRGTSMPKCDVNKVALQLCNFIKITLQHGCSPVNFLHIFRTAFPKNTSGGLLLSIPVGWATQLKLWFSVNSYWLLTFCCRSEQSHTKIRERKEKKFKIKVKFKMK